MKRLAVSGKTLMVQCDRCASSSRITTHSDWAAYITGLVEHVRTRARTARATVFRHEFPVRENTRILDIGSEDGTAIARVLAGTGIPPHNVYIADIDAARVHAGQRQFGFVPVVIPESGKLPFADGFFDIVYCSSVIEHVTVPKNEVWTTRSGTSFRRRAEESQGAFAQEIRRLGKSVLRANSEQVVPDRKSYLAAVRRLRSARSAARRHCGKQPLLDQAHEPGLAPAHRT